MRTLLEPMKSIETDLPRIWAEATDKEKSDVKTSLRTLLHDCGCCEDGMTKAVDSVDSTVSQRIRAMAISRRVQSNIRELAGSRGVDLATATASEITVAVSEGEINSLISLESLVSKDEIALVVTNEEMAVIKDEELAGSRLVRDPHWERDLTQLVEKAVPHPCVGMTTVSGSDLYVVTTINIKLDTLRPEVDDNGEVCAWIYEYEEA